MQLIATIIISLCITVLAPIQTRAQTGPQTSAQVNVTAELQRKPIEISVTKDLHFGTVIPKVNKTVSVFAPEAASVVISAEPSVQVLLSLSYPSELTNGSNSLPIQNWWGLLKSSLTQEPGEEFALAIGPKVITLSPEGKAFVSIGATVVPGNQDYGTYSGTIIITMVYP